MNLFAVPQPGWRRTRDFVRETKAVWLAFAASRLLILGLILLSRGAAARGKFWQPGGLLEVLTQWDSVYYIHIARHGYFASPESASTVAFFPFFPLLTSLMSWIILDVRLAGVVTANLCLLTAGLLLHRLVRVDFEEKRVADVAVILLMFSPVSFFFSMAYTEATFLMLALGSMLAALRKRWLLAGLCGLCLAATRNVGFWIAVPLFLEHLRQSWSRERPFAAFLHPRLLVLALVPVGLALFMLFTYLKSGDFLAFSHAGATWGRILVSPVSTLRTAQYLEPFYRWFFLGMLGIAVTLWCAGVAARLRRSYLVWAALLITTYLSSNSLEAIPRYLSVVFPFFIVLAAVVARHRWSYELVLAVSVSLLTICTFLLANGYWMT
ncbi:MAG: hypothetical protein H0V56_10135 [Chthoniobacterales bacterium]|nr:hypothetical protein [Chthoniobacterales bacterium]